MSNCINCGRPLKPQWREVTVCYRCVREAREQAIARLGQIVAGIPARQAARRQQIQELIAASKAEEAREARQ